MKSHPSIAAVLLAAALIWGAGAARAQAEDVAAPTVSALEFDGTRSHVDVSAAATTFGDFTIAGWFKIGNKGSEQFLFRITNDESRTRRIQVTEDSGTITADIRISTTPGSGSIYRISSSDFQYDAWFHIAFVRDGARLRLYFDGKEVAALTAESTPLAVTRWAFLGASTFRDGLRFGNPDGFFLGKIDEFQIWTVARTPREISASMTGSVQPANGLHAHWQFNERLGNRAFDSSGNGFAGRLIDTYWTLHAFTISEVHPQDGAVLTNAKEGMRFTLFTGPDGVDLDDIRLFLNGQDQSAELNITGTPRERYVEFLSLAPDRFYSAEIRVTDLQGRALSMDLSFDTFTSVHFQRRATWIGLGIGGGCFAVACGFVVQGRFRRKRELHELRLRLARDVHDEIGSNLAGIAVLSEVATETPASAVEQQEDWREVNRIARETVEAMREVLWLVGGRDVGGFDLMKHLQLAASRMLAGKEVHWKADSDPLPLSWPVEDQRQVFLFFKEAIANVARHAGATRVELSARVAKGRLRIVVVDNGCGFDPRHVENGVGLISQRMRARALRGTVEIRSEPGKGTTVSLDVPLRKG